MSMNVGFRPVSFRQQQPNKAAQQPLAGKIINPAPQPTKLPTGMPPLAGLITPPDRLPDAQPTYPLPPLAGLISVPPKTQPKTNPGPMAGNIKMP